MIDVRIENGHGNTKVKGNIAQLTTESLILIHWIYNDIREECEESAERFAEMFLGEVKLALDPNFEAKMRLKIMLKGVEEIVEMFKKGDTEA